MILIQTKGVEIKIEVLLDKKSVMLTADQMLELSQLTFNQIVQYKAQYKYI